MKSIGKNSRHVRIKYYFVTDRVKHNKLKIIYCPTKEMVVDFLTKLLQGMLFITHRNTLLSISQHDTPLFRKQYDVCIAQRNDTIITRTYGVGRSALYI